MVIMSIVVSAEDIKAFERLKAISQMAPIRERIKSFERKYGGSLETFGTRIKQREESFEEWDDLIEWKAYAESLKDLEAKIRRIDDAKDFRIAQG